MGCRIPGQRHPGIRSVFGQPRAVPEAEKVRDRTAARIPSRPSSRRRVRGGGLVTPIPDNLPRGGEGEVMRTINRSSTKLAALAVASAVALVRPSVSAQDLCADVIQAVSHGKAGFAQIKGAPGTGRYGRAGRVFDSTFHMTSVSPECDVWADEDRPQQLKLSCHRISREPGCESEARR